MSWVHNAEENWEPLSVVMDAGTPWFATMPDAKASATVADVTSTKGTATGHREKRSTAVSRCENPLELGMETKSTFQWSKRFPGTVKSPIG